MHRSPTPETGRNNEPGPILHIFASASWGGGEQFVYDLAQRLVSEGRRVVFIARPGGETAARAAIPGVPLHTLPLKGIADLLSVLRLARIAARCRPAVIHVHHFKDAFTAVGAKLLCRPAGIRFRIVVSRHLVRPGKKGRVYTWLYRHLDRVVFVSELARRAFFAAEPALDPSRTAVIHNSTPDPVQECAEYDPRIRYGLSPEVPLLVYTGRCAAEKGCDVLIRACARLGKRPYALLLIGRPESPEYERRLIRLIRENGLEEHIFMPGFSRHVKALLAQADIGILPTVEREAFGLSAIECMQSGVAVVTTDNGAQPEYIDEGKEGLLVPPGNEEALAAAIARLLDDPQLRSRIAAAGKAKFDSDLSYDRFYRKMCMIYDE